MRQDEATAAKMMAALNRQVDRKQRKGQTAEEAATLMVNSVGICCAELIRFMREFDEETGAGRHHTDQTVAGLHAHIENAARGGRHDG